MGERAQVGGRRDAERFLEGFIRDSIGVARLALEARGSEGRKMRSLGVDALDRCLALFKVLSALDEARAPLDEDSSPAEGETLETILVTVLTGREHVDAGGAAVDGARIPVTRKRAEIAAIIDALLDAAAAWSGASGFALRVRRRPAALALHLPAHQGRAPAPVWGDLLGLVPPHPPHLLRASPGEWRAREAALRAERLGGHLSLEWSSEGGAVLVFVLPEGSLRGATTLS